MAKELVSALQLLSADGPALSMKSDRSPRENLISTRTLNTPLKRVLNLEGKFSFFSLSANLLHTVWDF